MAWIWIHSATTLLLKRQPFLASHLVVCSCCLGLKWLFIPSLLVLKVSCTIIPDYSTGKWQATTGQHSVKVVRVMLFMWHTCFFLVWFSFFLNISTFSKPNPNHILASVWACFCMDVCVQYIPNLYLSLLSTSQAFRVRKQAKLQLLSVSRESGFCWADFVRSTRRSSAGLGTNGVNMDESRAKPNASRRMSSGWQQDLN